jgi:hypothetical protein
MIDAEVTIEVSVTCDQCKTTQSDSSYPDPWGYSRLDSTIENIIDSFTDDGWEIEDEAALCPDCIEAREDEVEPLDPYRENGGVAPEYGVGLRLFDA